MDKRNFEMKNTCELCAFSGKAKVHSFWEVAIVLKGRVFVRVHSDQNIYVLVVFI